MTRDTWLKIKHSYLDNRKTAVDTLVLAIAVVVTGWLVHILEGGEFIWEMTQKYEGFELDEILLTVVLSYIYLTIFTIRRYFELRGMVTRAHTDSLIGIMNRSRGSEVVRRELGRLKSPGRESVLIMFDIDHFKTINDRYGHDAGDLVLREVATVVLQEVREVDELIRWGGEEFLLLCPATSLAHGVELAERLRLAIAGRKMPPLPSVTASFGVTALNADQQLREQIARVDALLYASKNGGRNLVTADQAVLGAVLSSAEKRAGVGDTTPDAGSKEVICRPWSEC